MRTPEEREGDLDAQIGACRVGEHRLKEFIAKYGHAKVNELSDGLLAYTERLVRAELRKMPAGTFAAEDFMDSDGITDDPIRIAVAITFDPATGSAAIDFTGSSPQVAGSINAVYPITYSACFYVFRCLLGDDAPVTAGIMNPITVSAPAATIVNARPPAAVAGGNVECSQRIVDVLLRALAKAAPDRVPAASYGTMSNLTIGGFDDRFNLPFTYYETTAGGMGARPGIDGIDGIHCHMTNSLNTPIEALEYAYPFRVRSYSYRKHSGGAGEFKGGDGLIREDRTPRRRTGHAARRPPQIPTLRPLRRRRRQGRPHPPHPARRHLRNPPREVQHLRQQTRPHPPRNPRWRRLGNTEDHLPSLDNPLHERHST